MNLLFFLACAAEPPVVDTVQPDFGPTGTEITVTGAHFAEGSSVALGEQPLEGLVLSDTQAKGRVPEGLGTGRHDLVLTPPEGEPLRVAKAFDVVDPNEDPCASKVRTLAHIAPTADMVKIDRYHSDEDVERLTIKTFEIDAIQLQKRATEGDRDCSAIFVHTTKGRRYLFDASTETDLSDQAQRIAGGLGKSLERVKN